MRVLNWNIRQGGGTRVAEICRHIVEIAPDLLVLSEFQTRYESSLRIGLNDAQLPFVETSEPQPSRNGLLVASKWPLLESRSPAPDVDRERWLALRITDLDLDILAVHIPGAPDNKFEAGYGISGAKRKELMWERILAYAAEHQDQRAMVVGDLNTGLRIDAEGAMFKKSHYMRSLIDTGFIDTWRHQHPQVRGYTWYTKRKDKQTGESADLNGFRLDYLFVSPRLRNAIREAAILQDPRQAGVSDHASVVLEIEVDAIEAPVAPSPAVVNASGRQQKESNLGPQANPSSSPAVPRAGDSLQEEILSLLRRADCHYGNTLRDEEAGRSVEHAARERNVRADRIAELRVAVRRASNGEHSRTKAQAGHEDGVLRALLHFRNEMSVELRRHIDTRLAQLKAEFIPALKAVPLQCKTRGANRPQRAVSREHSCECGYTHAGECW
ncbi:MAG: hypothetical protein EKK34_25175 [Mycobacterium sp.]|nr:MAG: hypothetical protein EKK34_25175 [Mycobacterium sp.]